MEQESKRRQCTETVNGVCENNCNPNECWLKMMRRLQYEPIKLEHKYPSPVQIFNSFEDKQIIHLLNQIIMTQKEAAQSLVDLTATVNTLATTIPTLQDISPELATAITGLGTAISAVVALVTPPAQP